MRGTVGLSIFDGSSPADATTGASLSREFSLPPSLMPGMEFRVDGETFLVDRVAWDASRERLICYLRAVFKEKTVSGCVLGSFTDWLEEFRAAGWNCSKSFAANIEYWGQ